MKRKEGEVQTQETFGGEDGRKVPKLTKNKEGEGGRSSQKETI